MLPTQLLGPSAQSESRTRSWFPPFANCAKDGAPSCIGYVAKIKPWPPGTYEFARMSLDVPPAAGT
jgi:hypothetical protein